MTDAPPAQPLGAFQNEVYFLGLAGTLPPYPMDLLALEAAARDRLSAEAFGYVAGAAGSESTARANREAFERWRIVPRMLRGAAVRDLSTTVVGTPMPAPVLLAPVGVQGIIHPEAELATARAAASLGVPFVLSTVSSYSLEQVAEAAGDSPRWFQLYWPTDPDVATSLLQRAETAGYAAVVVTLDTTILGWRPRDLQAAYLPFLRGEGIASYTSDPAFCAPLPEKPGPGVDPGPSIGRWVGMFSNPGLTWDDLPFLRGATSLPILLKGVVDPDDARRAVDAGVDGLVVSNHGGRQVDGAVASLEALPRVLDAVEGALPVLFDSGIRTGADVMKAIALGASAVLLGRPYVYGLGLGGEEGVRQVLRCLLADFDLTMGLSGVASLAELGPDNLVRAGSAA